MEINVIDNKVFTNIYLKIRVRGKKNCIIYIFQISKTRPPPPPIILGGGNYGDCMYLTNFYNKYLQKLEISACFAMFETKIL